ncbi:hypothetical protein [Parasitella parasitica]|uniref:Uncharacterized protein n=1 Tax=Parasitella parasitica TaxID=35722 RepID=A0A0B7MX98_9FUNG|nr:hypothetical protein [Parasitella parasitica]
MLPDDELDFEDFGDLGDVDGPELTNEELEALEQELRDENASSLNQVDQGEQNKKAAQETATAAAKAPLKTSAPTTATSVALEKKEENTVNNNLEEGETLNDARPVPNKPGFTQQQQQQLPKFSKYNNNYKYNAYNRNGFYNQRPIPMK